MRYIRDFRVVVVVDVILSQEENSPEDPANPCVMYPTEEYSSYAECDDDYLRENIKEKRKKFFEFLDELDDISYRFKNEWKIGM